MEPWAHTDLWDRIPGLGDVGRLSSGLGGHWGLICCLDNPHAKKGVKSGHSPH